MITAEYQAMKDQLQASLDSVEKEIFDIDVKRMERNQKGYLLQPKWKTRRRNQLVAIRASFQAKLARF